MGVRMTTHEFAIEHLRKKRESLTHDGKRYVRLADEARESVERYEQGAIDITEQIASIDALLEEVGANG